jgi:hypothetical protein
MDTASTFGPVATALVIAGAIWLVVGLGALAWLAVALGHWCLKHYRDRRQRVTIVILGLAAVLLINWLVTPVFLFASGK